MELWGLWHDIASSLRPAFSRTRTYLWFLVALSGFCVRSDLLGVTSFARAHGLGWRGYDRLLDMFHSGGLDARRLRSVWVKAVLRFASPFVWQVNGRPVLLCDGIKIPKSGRRMPGVKKLHQESESNTKPEYIFGHMLQAVSLLATSGGMFFAIPLGAEIHDGVIFSNRCAKTLLDRLLGMVFALGFDTSAYLVADAYYGSRKMVRGLLDRGSHLVTRLKSNAVAYRPAERVCSRIGRPRLYGEKLRLYDLFDQPQGWACARVPLYGKEEPVEYLSVRLLWRPVGHEVLFVLVKLADGRRCVLLSSDLMLHPLLVLRMYAVRFKIEVGFKVSVRIVGAMGYHFWMRQMKRIGREGKNMYLHRESDEYRTAVRRKLAAYHNFIQIGLIAQGLMLLLALSKPEQVWSRFASWMRTMNLNGIPSEWVAAESLRNTLPEFLRSAGEDNDWAKFLRENAERKRPKSAA